MRKPFIVVSALALLVCLSGCAMGPKPAKSELKGAESTFVSDRDEDRGRTDTMTIKATAPKPKPVIHLNVIVVPDAPAQK